MVFAIDSSEKRLEFLAKTFLFCSAGMVAARWNLVRTERGPLVQKVADPWSKAKPKIHFEKKGLNLKYSFALSVCAEGTYNKRLKVNL